MIYIATVHWKNDFWPKIQKIYIDYFASSLYKTYAFLSRDLKSRKDDFYFSISSSEKDHWIKLDRLANIIVDSSSPNDIMIFLDGDAFPVGDFMSLVLERLKHYPFLAIQRTENLGDKIPHPSFAATTCQFWKENNLSWKPGEFENNLGNTESDVGGHLYNQLIVKKIPWFKVCRSNKTNIHPVMFGIYGDVIYHHAAGFRSPITRFDQNQNKGISEIIKENKELSDKMLKSINENFLFFEDLKY